MRIFMICEFYGANLQYQENALVKYYRKMGYDVLVVTSTFENVFDYYGDKHDPKAPRTEFQDFGARIVRLPYRYNLLNRLRAYVDLTPLLEEFKPDLIFMHDIIPNIPELVRYLDKNRHVKMIMDYHADYSNSGKNWLSLRILHGVIRKRLLDRAMPYLSDIFPIVPAGIRFLNEIYKVPLERMTLLPLGADVELAHEVAMVAESSLLRSRLRIDDSSKVIVTGGKLDEKKQTHLVIDAMELLRNEKIDLLIVGDAEENSSEYKNELLQRSKNNTRIHFTGWLSPKEMFAHFGISDIAVFPASQSILWQQAIAMGLPLLVGDTGDQDASYMNLHQNVVVLRAEHITADNIADTIQTIIYTPGRLECMSAGSRRVADEMLSWERIVERTLRCTHSYEKE